MNRADSFVVCEGDTPDNRCRWMTGEQAQAFELAGSGASLNLIGYVATGKTSVLRAIAMHTRARATRALLLGEVRDPAGLARMPANVDLRNIWSFAYRALGHRYRDRLGPLTALVLAARLGLTTDFAGMTPRVLATLVLGTLKRFMRSEDMEIDTRHLPSDLLHPLSGRDTYEALTERILDLAGTAWAMTIDPRSDCPVTHAAYLKAWQLSGARIDADVIVLDDAGTQAPVVCSIVASQSAQKIVAIDPYQAEEAAGDLRAVCSAGACCFTRSFGFGAAIADVVRTVLASAGDTLAPILGSTAIASRVERITQRSLDAEICRTEAGVLRAVMAHRRAGRRIAVLGGVERLLARLRAAQTLLDGRPATVMPFALFRTWRAFEYCAEGERDGEWLALLRAVRAYGVPDLIEAVESVAAARGLASGRPSMTLAPLHRTGGCYWDRVRLGDDFTGPDEPGFGATERNLLYLAVTRARRVLDVSRCKTLGK